MLIYVNICKLFSCNIYWIVRSDEANYSREVNYLNEKKEKFAVKKYFRWPVRIKF